MCEIKTFYSYINDLVRKILNLKTNLMNATLNLVCAEIGLLDGLEQEIKCAEKAVDAMNRRTNSVHRC